MNCSLPVHPKSRSFYRIGSFWLVRQSFGRGSCVRAALYGPTQSLTLSALDVSSLEVLDGKASLHMEGEFGDDRARITLLFVLPARIFIIGCDEFE